MRRRDFLKAVTAAMVVAGISPRALGGVAGPPPIGGGREYGAALKDYLEKMKRFYQPHSDDTFLESEKLGALEAVVRRLERLQLMAGHGRFQLLSFDQGLEIARMYSQVGPFTKTELDFLEAVFHTDARRYGFQGEKSITNMTERILTNEVVKVPGTGNYLYKGLPLDTYERVKKDIGDLAILTSGVRGVMKQFLLFLRRAHENKGNFSLASRSLAPPGYSFHGISDFDLGQVGLGQKNFTEEFVTSEVFRKLVDREYFRLRYPQDNLDGVRFEPWHIKVDCRG